VLPVEQDEAELFEKLAEKLPPATRAAKVDICFFTWLLPQAGQMTPSVEAALRSSSSKGRPHSVQTNSKIGMPDSLR
jgi:hypothetical protein